MQEQNVITADMNIGDVVQKYPHTVEVFFRHGQGAMAHRIDVDVLIKDLNQSLSRP